jgi:quinoprotein glucose dehydrogenase
MMQLFKIFLIKIILFLVLLIGYSCQSDNTNSESEFTRESTWKDRFNNFTNWGTYRGDKQATHYSELDQVNRENVHLLEPVWTYETRGLVGPGMQSNPIIIDGLMYFPDPEMNVVALNAATGEEVWLFDPTEHYHDDSLVRGQLLKGVVYWEDADGNNQRIFHFTRDLIWAINPATGDVIESFGENGYIDTKENHVWDYDDLVGRIEYTTPGITYKNYLIVGSKVGEGNVSAPGNIRAFDTVTGEYKWTFHTVPLEGQYGYDTWEWEENMIYGGPIHGVVFQSTRKEAGCLLQPEPQRENSFMGDLEKGQISSQIRY